MDHDIPLLAADCRVCGRIQSKNGDGYSWMYIICPVVAWRDHREHDHLEYVHISFHCPLIRVLSLCIPLMHFENILRFAIVSIPLFIAIFTCIHILHIDGKSVGLTPPRSMMLRLEGAIVVSAIPLGWMEYQLLKPALMVAAGTSWIVPALIFIVCTGFLEELLFRGLLQHTFTEGMGARDIHRVCDLWHPSPWKLVVRLHFCRDGWACVCACCEKNRVYLWCNDIARADQYRAFSGHAVYRAFVVMMVSRARSCVNGCSDAALRISHCVGGVCTKFSDAGLHRLKDHYILSCHHLKVGGDESVYRQECIQSQISCCVGITPYNYL